MTARRAYTSHLNLYLLPHLGEVADDICLVRSMHTDAVNHHPGQLLLFSVSTQVGRPTLGAWTVCQGLATVLTNPQNTPRYVLRKDPLGVSRRIFEMFVRGIGRAAS